MGSGIIVCTSDIFVPMIMINLYNRSRKRRHYASKNHVVAAVIPEIQENNQYASLRLVRLAHHRRR